MQKYLVRHKPKGGVGLGKHQEEHLTQMHEGLSDALKRGRVDAAWSTAGGGSVFVVNAEHHGDLMRALHRINAHGVDITPVVDTLDLIEEHILHRRSEQGGEPATAADGEEREDKREAAMFRALRHRIRHLSKRGEDPRRVSQLAGYYQRLERRRRRGEDVIDSLQRMLDRFS